MGAKVKAYDPQAMGEALQIYGVRSDFLLMKNRDETLNGADALVICTEWKGFRAVNFNAFKKKLAAAVIVDGRNLFDSSAVSEARLLYFAVGRGDSVQWSKM